MNKFFMSETNNMSVCLPQRVRRGGARGRGGAGQVAGGAWAARRGSGRVGATHPRRGQRSPEGITVPAHR